MILKALNAVDDIIHVSPKSKFQAFFSEVIAQEVNEIIPQFNEITWPSVPLYPSEENQFIRALQLVYGGIIKIRSGIEKNSILLHGKTIEGFEIDLKDNEPIYTHSFDYQNGSVDFHVIQKREIVPVWPGGGFYRPGCQIDQIQQVFCSLSEQDRQTFVRNTLLYQWNEQGFYPPMTNVVDEQQTVFQTSRVEPYVKFFEDIEGGAATIHLIDSNTNNKFPYCRYQSIGIKSYGIDTAFIYFKRTS